MKIKGLIDGINDCTSYKARIDGKLIYLLTSSEDCLTTFSCDVNYLSDIKFNYRFLDYEPNVKCYDLGNFYALLNLINDFVNTPIEKRYPEKKYTIRTISDSNDSYLIRTVGGNYFFGCLKMRDSYGDQVSFTKDEIEEMKLDDDLAIDWSKATITIEEDK